jgi:heat shock protein HslJ
MTLRDNEGVLYLYGYTASDYINTNWAWVEYTDASGSVTAVENPEMYTVLFAGDMSYTVAVTPAGFIMGCLGSGYITQGEGDQLTLTWVVSPTIEGCADAPLADLFVEQFAKVSSITEQDGNLILSLSDGGSMRFTPINVEVLNVEWQWQDFEGSDGSVVTVPNPANYSLLLNEDGTVSVRADCNVGNGTHTLSSGSLTIDVQVMTEAACPPESLSQQYLDYLANARTFVVQDGYLYLNLQADAGNMRFAAAP